MYTPPVSARSDSTWIHCIICVTHSQQACITVTLNSVLHQGKYYIVKAKVEVRVNMYEGCALNT